MRIANGQVRLSASDISNHLGCRHLTTLNHQLALNRLEKPAYRPATEVLQHRGMEHEKAYLEHLRKEGREILELPEAGSDPANRQATLEAMKRGVDVIAQATFFTAEWFGRADVLLRVNHPSALGPWSYEVADTKLSQTTKAGTILQLCLYSELLGEAQDLLPREMHVVVPRRDFEPESYRVKDYLAYYRLVRGRLSQAVEQDPDSATTYPTPTAHCDICQWWKNCTDRRRADDHLCLVAGLGRDHETQLKDWDIPTLTALANADSTFDRPKRGSQSTYEKLHHQARLQLESRGLAVPLYELLAMEPERGFCRLPEPSPGDIFLDLEGDAFVEPQGLEYVIGWVVENDGQPHYETIWSLDDFEERSAFDQFMQFVIDRLQHYPGLHIYHYAPYEPSAFKRMMGKHALHEEGVDALLRGGKFVDLYAVVRQGLRAGVERYSIKDLEPLYGFERELPLREASTARFVVETALEMGRPEQITRERRAELNAYNRDDCVSTLRLRDWLEKLRYQLTVDGEEIARPAQESGKPSKKLDAKLRQAQAIRDQLLSDVPTIAEERNPKQEALWLLAHMIEWHRREIKVKVWEKYRLSELSDLERLDEPRAIGGLEFSCRNELGTPQNPVDRYTFPLQDFNASDRVAYVDADTRLGTVVAVDSDRGTLDVKKTQKTAKLHPKSLFFHRLIGGGAIEESILRLAEYIAERGLDDPGPHQVAVDLLLRRPPRGVPASNGHLRLPEENLIASASRIASALDCGVLPIQGPPGAGKTYTGARMIVELVRQGKTVGITALSHKVIRHLLDETIVASQEGEVDLRAVQKVGGDHGELAKDGPIIETEDNDRVASALASGEAQVGAGTAFLWARPDLANSVDVLVVDEAGQMALTIALGAAQAAKSIILVGDPQQLEQPTQGAHPEGADKAALDHLLDGRQTVLPDRGLFLDHTWRLHPSICSFTSEMFYEGRLHARPGLEHQAIVGRGPLSGSGLTYLPTIHAGNQSSAPEEVDIIAKLVEQTLVADTHWTSSDGSHQPLTLGDILIVAPYNAQVMLLSQRLPNAKVGTVDKFQGQEAPVVIYSMTSSTPQDAPRGMEFLYSRSRLNVATSRARCLCVLVGSPALFEPDCRTPRQIELANALCYYLEHASKVTLGD
ncbi:MAG: TM0106 family RecB-like putative nuclease [Thermoanaerobaculia bacterium]|nr:TM0106 family RecB-like putative nuclease [Thermoanaerobaculia bacterium]